MSSIATDANLINSFDKLLSAADTLSNHGRDEFTLQELIVHAWKRYPKEFGLPDFINEHPDSHRVASFLYGNHGLVGAEFLTKVGRSKLDRRWTITSKGLIYLSRLDGSLETQSGATVGDDAELQRLLRTDVYSAFLNGGTDQLKFAQACSFFNISENDRREMVPIRMERLQSCLDRLEIVIDAKELVVQGRKIHIETINLLRNAVSFLAVKFRTHFKLLRK